MLCSHPAIRCFLVLTALAISGALDAPAAASTSGRQTNDQPDAPRVMLIELYVNEGQAESELARNAARKLAEARPGIQVITRIIEEKPETKARFDKIVEFYNLNPDETPVVYGCGQAIQGKKTEAEFEAAIQQMLKLQVFTQEGCTHCDAAHAYLDQLSKRYPGLEVVYRSITTDLEARDLVGSLSRELGVPVPETPIIYICHQLLVGFDDQNATDQRMTEILQQWSIEDVAPASSDGGANF